LDFKIQIWIGFRTSCFAFVRYNMILTAIAVPLWRAMSRCGGLTPGPPIFVLVLLELNFSVERHLSTKFPILHLTRAGWFL
ncbi:hypothetical protein HAX54_015222, partial [Datura stramonium]|nr:hypothetical protein [Datura stramonium]